MGTPDVQSKHIAVIKRTWRDAACEVAWNACKNQLFWSPLLFLCGYSANSYIWDYTDYHNNEIFIRVDLHHGPAKNDFNNFYDGFMKWLNENEVKR